MSRVSREEIRKTYPFLKTIEQSIFERYYSVTDEYLYEIYELVHYSKQIPRKQLYKEFKNGYFGWNNEEYLPFHDEEKEEDEGCGGGILTCRACKSDKVYTYNKQTRSADEGATVFAHCSECGKKWRESG